jgi:NADH:ubiquinone oxidoreductase subunit F (NADH-binding)
MESIKIITKDWGKINPLKIEDYINAGGYQALYKFIFQMNSEKALEEIKSSGLCGRGGAGFPTGKKIEMTAKAKGKTKYFVCNLDESEPGTYKDREIADNNPHLMLEGIIISSLIIGAKKAYIYLNGQYQKEKEILENALNQAKEEGFLGERIMDSKYKLDIEIFSGAGAYICGEETALLNSIEGKRGEPRMRPPYPSENGLFGKPTGINNAETVSNIPWIILNGGKKYARIGSPKSPGTKIYILDGAIKKPAVIEAPLGMTLREIIFEIGGGMSLGKEFWFAQIGGASGRLATVKDLDTILSYDREAEFPLGTGAILVIDKTTNIHDLLLSWSGFFRRESCGKCVPCREGTFRLWEIAKRLKDGEISERDKLALDDILWTLDKTSFCPLGKFASVAFRDALKNFNKEIFKNVDKNK